MAGWTSPDRDLIEWDGTIKAKSFLGAGGGGLSAETDPYWSAQSGAYTLNANHEQTSQAVKSVSSAYVAHAASSALHSNLWTSNATHIFPIDSTKIISGAGFVTTGNVSGAYIYGDGSKLTNTSPGVEADPIWAVQSAAYAFNAPYNLTSAAYLLTSAAYVAHAADSSDPHGVTLTQTNLTGTQISSAYYYATGTISGATISGAYAKFGNITAGGQISSAYVYSTGTISGATFSGSYGAFGTITGTQISSAYIYSTGTISGATVSGAYAKFGTITGTQISSAYYYATGTISGAVFSGAAVTFGNISGAYIQCSQFSGANATMAVISGTNMFITADFARTSAAYVANAIYNTTSVAVTASNYPIGSILYVYT